MGPLQGPVVLDDFKIWKNVPEFFVMCEIFHKMSLPWSSESKVLSSTETYEVWSCYKNFINLEIKKKTLCAINGKI